MVVVRVPVAEAVGGVFSGSFVTAMAVAGILPAQAWPDAEALRPVDAVWTDRPTAFRRRKGLL
jgi:ADP-ribose pyrophosphatase